jgi:DNA replication protein DnaC
VPWKAAKITCFDPAPCKPSNAQVAVHHTNSDAVVQENQIRLDKGRQAFQSAYERVLPEATSQSEVYAAIEHVVTDSLQGYNATVIAYGQTGTGKTHTMMGPHNIINVPGALPAPDPLWALQSRSLAQTCIMMMHVNVEF